jgi:hypothetical protein
MEKDVADVSGLCQRSDMETKHTAGPWKLAITGGETMPAPEGLTESQKKRWEQIAADQRRPVRHNDGSFIITATDEHGDSFPVATALSQIKAKRGQAHTSEDPVGLANAYLIASTTELLEAARVCATAVTKQQIEQAQKLAQSAINKVTA